MPQRFASVSLDVYKDEEALTAPRPPVSPAGRAAASPRPRCLPAARRAPPRSPPPPWRPSRPNPRTAVRSRGTAVEARFSGVPPCGLGTRGDSRGRPYLSGEALQVRRGAAQRGYSRSGFAQRYGHGASDPCGETPSAPAPLCRPPPRSADPRPPLPAPVTRARRPRKLESGSMLRAEPRRRDVGGVGAGRRGRARRLRGDRAALGEPAVRRPLPAWRGHGAEHRARRAELSRL